MNDPKLTNFATETEARMLRAIEEEGSYRAAARAIGVDESTVRRTASRVKARAAISGYAPTAGLDQEIPAPFTLNGYSKAVKGADGGLTWYKAKVDPIAHMALMRASAAAFYEGVEGLEAPAGPKAPSDDIIPWIQIGDAHLGMLAHSSEVGENFDLKIGESELCGAIGILIDELPECERLVINDLGDMSHYCNMAGTTEASGHALDYDTRFHKMIRVYSRVMRFVVDKALTKASHVDVIVNQGNHSRTNDIWMAELLRVAYEGTGRVHVLNNDSVFIGYRMGKTLVMIHHGDKCRPHHLAQVMMTDFRRDYGETDYHYVDVGHYHHAMSMKEYPGVVVETWNHLAASDKWAHEAGYRSRKCISYVLRSKTYGEVGRRTLPIQEVRDRIGSGNPANRRAYAV